MVRAKDKATTAPNLEFSLSIMYLIKLSELDAPKGIYSLAFTSRVLSLIILGIMMVSVFNCWEYPHEISRR